MKINDDNMPGKLKSLINYFKTEEINNSDDEEQFRIEIDEMNKKEQEYLEKEFMEYKNSGLILFDIIPIKDRKSLIESLKKLFDYDNLTPFQQNQDRYNFEKVLPKVEIESTHHGYSIINIGTIQNLNLEDGYYDTPERKLPSMYHNLRIRINHFKDVYLLIIGGELKKEFKTKEIKESFIHLNDFEPIIKKSEDGRFVQSAKKSGIKWDPNMESYLEELTNFLKYISFGIYLNKNSDYICPNIKVAYMEEIPFDDFDKWSLKNRQILNFIGFSVPIFSKIYKNLWGIQEKRITNRLSISAGLVILTSKDEYIDDKYESSESGYLINIIDFISFNKFIDILYRVYWANYNLEKIAKDSKKSQDYVDKLNKIENQKVKNKMKSLFKLNNEITKKYLNFGIYRIIEERKYYHFIKNIKCDKRLKDLVKPLENIDVEYNIYKYIFFSGKELLEYQKREIESLKKEYDLLFNYLNNVTCLTSSQINLKCQGRIKTYTFIVLIFTFIMILLNIKANLLSIFDTYIQ